MLTEKEKEKMMRAISPPDWGFKSNPPHLYKQTWGGPVKRCVLGFSALQFSFPEDFGAFKLCDVFEALFY
jgi:hypothetical protein